MIETLSIRNFKVLREVDVRLRPLTLIVGPNASGKSSILDVLFRLTRDVDDLRRRTERFLSRVPRGVLEMGIAGRIGGAEFRWKLADGNLAAEGPRPLSATLLRLEVQKLAAVSELKGVSLDLPNDGEGLSAILAGLSLEHPDRFRALVERLRSVVPVIQNVRIARTSVGGDRVGFQVLFDARSGDSIRAADTSEGTLLTLGLLTALTAPTPPKLVLIDDLERGLHPRALGELIQLLRKVQEQDPELQIVATSHSPYLLDHLQAEEILLTALDDDGYAVVRSLAEHPDYERWKDVMAPGEFWSTVGESWVTAAKK